MKFRYRPSVNRSKSATDSVEQPINDVNQLDDWLIKQSFDRAYKLSRGQNIFSPTTPIQPVRPRYSSPKGAQPMKKTAPKGAAPIPPYRTNYWRGNNRLGIKKR